jgi:hypothetical protein
LTASAITRDLAADAMEVTQAIQNLANAAPLVAQKTTYVRAYAKTGQRSEHAHSRRAAGGQTQRAGPARFAAERAQRRALADDRAGTYDRSRLNDGWLFLLPASWTEGTVSLEFQVDPRSQHTDPNVGKTTR